MTTGKTIPLTRWTPRKSMNLYGTPGLEVDRLPRKSMNLYEVAFWDSFLLSSHD